MVKKLLLVSFCLGSIFVSASFDPNVVYGSLDSEQKKLVCRLAEGYKDLVFASWHFDTEKEEMYFKMNKEERDQWVADKVLSKFSSEIQDVNTAKDSNGALAKIILDPSCTELLKQKEITPDQSCMLVQCSLKEQYDTAKKVSEEAKKNKSKPSLWS